jgi:hypothetical protein
LQVQILPSILGAGFSAKTGVRPSALRSLFEAFCEGSSRIAILRAFEWALVEEMVLASNGEILA